MDDVETETGIIETLKLAKETQNYGRYKKAKDEGETRIIADVYVPKDCLPSPVPATIRITFQ